MSESSHKKTISPAISPQTVIQDFLQSPDEVMRNIYRENRSVFLAWAKNRTKLQDDDLVDLFQDCVIIFCQNIRRGKLTELNSSVRTYLFGIAKNLIHVRWKNTDRITFPGDENLVFSLDFDAGIEQMMIEDEEQLDLEKMLAKLSENCQKMLVFTFFDQLKSAQIAKQMGYSSEEVVRVQRKRCLDKLRTYFGK